MNTIEIAGRPIGMNQPCFIVAEVGVNHNGDSQLARQLVREAKRCGADCVKFQTFQAEHVVTRNAPKADYQLKVTDPAESQLKMLKALELSKQAHRDLFNSSVDEGILFLSTPYSMSDAEMLNDLGVAAFKVASGQIIELSFLEALARFGKPMIVSTGMATLREVELAMDVIHAAGNDQIILLQCTTDYPSRVSDANLRAMCTMAKAFDCLVGYSDHTQGINAALAAVALGACVVEKHFTLDKNLPGPDHSSSADPDEFRSLTHGIRDIESALGSAIKQPSETESRNAVGMRRSIVAATDIPLGSVVTAEMLTFKRPASGISPALLKDVIGRIAKVNISADTLLTYEHLK